MKKKHRTKTRSKETGNQKRNHWLDGNAVNAANAAARLLHDAKKTDSIHPILFDLHSLPIVFRIDYKIAVFTYRCLNGLSLLRFPVSSRMACDRLITAKPRTKTYDSRSFTVYATLL
jgi:hypothetical protein